MVLINKLFFMNVKNGMESEKSFLNYFKFHSEGAGGSHFGGSAIASLYGRREAENTHRKGAIMKKAITAIIIASTI